MKMRTEKCNLLLYSRKKEKENLKKFYVIQMGEIRYSSFHNFERTIIKTTGLFDLPIPSQPFPADATYSENSGKACT